MWEKLGSQTPLQGQESDDACVESWTFLFALCRTMRSLFSDEGDSFLGS